MADSTQDPFLHSRPSGGRASITYVKQPKKEIITPKIDTTEPTGGNFVPVDLNKAPDEPFFPASFEEWNHQDSMLGGLGGLRKRLERNGIIIKGRYLEDTSGNPVGGKSQGVRYAHEFALGTDIDLLKLTGYDIGIFHFLVTERAGLSLATSMLPAISSVQEIFGSGETVRLTRLTLEHHFNRYIAMEAGWFSTENDFAESSIHWNLYVYCEFQSNAICGMPQSLAFNSGYGWYPTAHPGSYLKLYPFGNKHFMMSGGIYNVDNTISNTHNGWKLGLNNTTGSYLPFQFLWSHGGTDEHGALPGNIRLGGYWDTSEVKIVTNGSARFQPASVNLINLPQQSVRGRYGGWIEVDQMLQRDHDGSSRGTLLFLSYVWGDPRTSLAPYFATWGIIRKGTFPSRPNDTINFGGKILILNPKLADYAWQLRSLGEKAYIPSNENSIELNYGWRPNPWATIRPGLQYLWHPGGTNRYPNALILDFEVGFTF
ncbi:carbohydrate porin [Acetobacter conturbans]|nr:carbohydrate porin [Acetobacter conturbans]